MDFDGDCSVMLIMMMQFEEPQKDPPWPSSFQCRLPPDLVCPLAVFQKHTFVIAYNCSYLHHNRYSYTLCYSRETCTKCLAIGLYWPNLSTIRTPSDALWCCTIICQLIRFISSYVPNLLGAKFRNTLTFNINNRTVMCVLFAGLCEPTQPVLLQWWLSPDVLNVFVKFLNMLIKTHRQPTYCNVENKTSCS